MEIVKIKIEDLTPYENNAKEHPREQIEQIKKSIQEYGMNDPLGVWGEKNIIIEGHGRLMALQELGYKEVECIRLDHLTDEERRAYTLVHNKLTMNTDFDFDILEEELKQLSCFDIDMTKYGFDDLSQKEKEPKERKDLSDEIHETYEVIIECNNEIEQQEIFERLIEEGYTCRVLTL